MTVTEIKAKIKALKAELRVNQKVYNMAERALLRTTREIEQLEKKLELKLAKLK
jgi:hypothetical protein